MDHEVAGDFVAFGMGAQVSEFDPGMGDSAAGARVPGPAGIFVSIGSGDGVVSAFDGKGEGDGEFFAERDVGEDGRDDFERA